MNVKLNGIDRVKHYIDEKDINAKIVVLDSSTKTSKLAAEALGCTIAQIAKSIVFKGSRPIVVVISGDKKVDLTLLSNIVKERVEMADPEYIQANTGYRVGGVPPFPHNPQVKTYLDASLFRWSEVWAAAGEPNAVMKIKVSDLQNTICAEIINVSKD
ncbi:MAG: YbaK/EbsC family protein [Nitrososphaerales archaeon]